MGTSDVGTHEVGVLDTAGRVLRVLLFLPEQASSFAGRVDRLHYFVILTTFAAATAIGLTGLWFLIRYRRRPGEQTAGAFSSPAWMEVLIIGVPLSFFLLWFFLGFRDFVYLRSPPKDAMDVHVMGKQWMWKFSYPDGPNGLEVLRVPRGRPVRLLITSRDVIHSFFVPAFRLKQDAVPGRYTEVWFEATQEGRFDVLCAEYCGTEHSRMRAEIEVMDPTRFDAWFAEQRRGLAARQDGGGPLRTASIVDQGRQAAVRHQCLTCHSTDGTAHIGPTWLDLYGRRETLEGGQAVVADESYLTESMMDPLAKLVAGFGPVMPTYQGQLNAPDAAAIVEYIKSLRSGLQQPVPARRPAYGPVPR